LHSEKEVSDRTNIIIAANSFLLLPFTGLLTSSMITGYLNAIPILICIIGIGLNSFLWVANFNQNKKINAFLKENLTKGNNLTENYPKLGLEDAYKYFNKYGSPFLSVVWIACLIFFALQKTIGIL
jgi:hypothetical protein